MELTGKNQCFDFLKRYGYHLVQEGSENCITYIGSNNQISNGIPRMINRVCEKSLMYACQRQKRLIDDHMISFVAEHEMLANAIIEK